MMPTAGLQSSRFQPMAISTRLGHFSFSGIVVVCRPTQVSHRTQGPLRQSFLPECFLLLLRKMPLRAPVTLFQAVANTARPVAIVAITP